VSEEISGRLVNCTASLPKSDMQAWALLNYTKTSFHPDAIHGLVARAVEPAVAVVYTNATRTPSSLSRPGSSRTSGGLVLRDRLPCGRQLSAPLSPSFAASSRLSGTMSTATRHWPCGQIGH
jgi:hypothetical protein